MLDFVPTLGSAVDHAGAADHGSEPVVHRELPPTTGEAIGFTIGLRTKVIALLPGQAYQSDRALRTKVIAD
jgi:hypothetical protein